MGYFVSITRAEFAVPENEEVLKVLKDANWKYHDWKRGGSFGGEHEEKWFSWMPANYDVQVDLVYDVFLKLGFDVSVDGNMVHLNSYDNKSGQEDLFLAIVAPYVEEGSFIEWVGEDGTTWRHEVIDGKLTVAEGVKQFATPKPYKLLAYEIPKTGRNSEDLLGYWIECDPYSTMPPSEQFARETGSLPA